MDWKMTKVQVAQQPLSEGKDDRLDDRRPCGVQWVAVVHQLDLAQPPKDTGGF